MLHTKWATHVILDTEIMNRGDNFWQYKIFKLQQNSVFNNQSHKNTRVSPGYLNLYYVFVVVQICLVCRETHNYTDIRKYQQ